jgi:hypothetical protein
VTKEEPMTALAESRQSLESPLQGNLHGGFGGGSGETQFGCAPCSYLTCATKREDEMEERPTEVLPIVKTILRAK